MSSVAKSLGGVGELDPAGIVHDETISFTRMYFGCIKLFIWAVTTEIFRIAPVLIWPWKLDAVRTPVWRSGMRNRFTAISVAVVSLFVVSAPLFAHHGNAAYDTDKRITLKGTVTDWLWSNPHCLVQLDVTNDSGQVARWVLETENPSSMIRTGWTKDSMKVGDQVTATVVQVKDGRPIGRIVDVVLPSGEKLKGRAVAEAKAPAEPPKQ